MQRRRLLLAAALISVAACASDVIVHGVNEKEANQIIEVLADEEVSSQKLVNATGREVVYDVAVPGGQRLRAIRVLNRYDLPRRRDKGYQETFVGGGLIPTSSEERAKRMAALEGEIEKQIKLLDGVLDVQVQIVQPEESALRTTQQQEPATTASVTIKYLEGANKTKPIMESDVQQIVAAGVEKLSPENVVVIMRSIGSFKVGAKDEIKPMGVLTTRQTMIVGVVGLVVILMLGLGLLFTQISLRRVRSRFVRLQNEIAKARQKKPGEALPAQSSSPGSSASLTSP